jgi:hypothetical protein
MALFTLIILAEAITFIRRGRTSVHHLATFFERDRRNNASCEADWKLQA